MSVFERLRNGRTATRRYLPLLVVAAVVALSIGAVSIVLHTDLLRSAIEGAAARRLDREVRIGGLDIGWSGGLAVRLAGVHVSNAEWAAESTFVSIDEATAVVAPWPLLVGRVSLRRLELREPVVNLERLDDGRANWTFARDDDAPGRAWALPARITIDDGRLRFADAQSRTKVDAAATVEGQLLELAGHGSWRGRPFAGTAALPLAYPEPGQPFAIRAAVVFGHNTATFAGTLATGSEIMLEGHLRAAGDSLEELHLIGLTLPDTPPYSVGGHLSRARATWTFERFSGRVGDSDISGTLSYHTDRERPLLAGELKSRLLDFDDLAPVVGAPPQAGKGETASAQQRRDAARRAASDRVLPDRTFNIERWPRMDADISLRGERILRAARLPISTLSVQIQLRDSRVRLAPLTFGVAGGEVTGEIELDGRASPLQGKAALRFRRLELPKLFPTVESMRASLGYLYGEAKLDGRGNSVAALLGSSDGTLNLVIDGGRISNLVLELAGLDAAESLRLLATGDKQIKLHCALADLRVDNGVATAEALLIDTEDTVITGRGKLDLRNETVDMQAFPAPKDPSPFAARVPLQVRGPLKAISVTPDAAALATLGGTAALLALINPLLALLPFIETGPGRDSDCAAVMSRLKVTGKPAARPAENAPRVAPR